MAHLQETFRKSYNLRRHGPETPYLQVTIPYKVVMQIAATKGLNLDEFIKRYGVIIEYGGAVTIQLTFAEKIKRKRG